jgi:hypothetical protein
MARFGLKIRLPTQIAAFFAGGDGAWWSRVRLKERKYRNFPSRYENAGLPVHKQHYKPTENFALQ